jgi:iron complex transport system substrate-binding protein
MMILYRLAQSASTALVLVTLVAGCPSTDAPRVDAPAEEQLVPLADSQQWSLHRTGRSYRVTMKAVADDVGERPPVWFQERDSPAPSSASIPIPVRRLACLSSTHIGFLSELDALDIVAGVTTRRHIANRWIRERISDGRVDEVGEGAQLDLEKLLTIEPDLVLAFGVSEADLSFAHRLTAAGVPVVFCAEYLEATPLGRAEWIKFFGLLTGRWEQAESRFRDIKGNYRRLAEQARSMQPRPSVLVNADFQGVWYMPGGQSYMARFLRDAGARYLWEDDASARVLRLDFEQVLTRARDADVWINVGVWRTLAEGSSNDARYSLFRPFREKQVFNHRRPMGADEGNDFFERGVARPDLVLADLVKIFHPSCVASHDFVWYERLPAK